MALRFGDRLDCGFLAIRHGRAFFAVVAPHRSKGSGLVTLGRSTSDGLSHVRHRYGSPSGNRASSACETGTWAALRRLKKWGKFSPGKGKMPLQHCGHPEMSDGLSGKAVTLYLPFPWINTGWSRQASSALHECEFSVGEREVNSSSLFVNNL